MDSEGCWVIQSKEVVGQLGVYACDTLASKCDRHVVQAPQIDVSPVWCNYVELVCLFCCFAKLLTIPSQIISTYHCFLIHLRWTDGRLNQPEPTTTKGRFQSSPLPPRQVLLQIQWWWWWCRTQWWPWWWGVQAIGVVDECWSIGSAWHNQHGITGITRINSLLRFFHIIWIYILPPRMPVTSRIITSLVGNPYKLWFATGILGEG